MSAAGTVSLLKEAWKAVKDKHSMHKRSLCCKLPLEVLQEASLRLEKDKIGVEWFSRRNDRGVHCRRGWRMANMMARMDVKVMLACGYGARLTRVCDPSFA